LVHLTYHYDHRCRKIPHEKGLLSQSEIEMQFNLRCEREHKGNCLSDLGVPVLFYLSLGRWAISDVSPPSDNSPEI
jgi:hypothetical protein